MSWQAMLPHLKRKYFHVIKSINQSLILERPVPAGTCWMVHLTTQTSWGDLLAVGLILLYLCHNEVLWPLGLIHSLSLSFYVFFSKTLVVYQCFCDTFKVLPSKVLPCWVYSFASTMWLYLELQKQYFFVTSLIMFF